MLKLISIIVLFLFISTAGFSKQLMTFESILQPSYIAIQGDRLYILEKFTVNVFSLDDFSLLLQFGKQGQGPGEHPFPPQMKVKDQIIALSSFNKIVLYSSNKGKVLKEKVFNLSMIGNFQFIGQHFIIKKLNRVNNGLQTEFLLLDNNLEIIKSYYTLVRANPKNIDNKKPVEIFEHGDFIKAQGETSFLVKIREDLDVTALDVNGNVVYKISRKFPKTKIPQQVKDKYINNFMSKFSKDRQKKIKKMFAFKFPVNYPAIKNLKVSGNRLFMRTFSEKNGKCLYYQTDLMGNHFKKIYLPIAERNLNCFNGKSFYYLKENNDTEDWQLHRLNLDE